MINSLKSSDKENRVPIGFLDERYKTFKHTDYSHIIGIEYLKKTKNQQRHFLTGERHNYKIIENIGTYLHEPEEKGRIS